jgi:hypothetical protein
MKRLTVWALLATLVVAGSAFAAPVKIAENATFAFGSPATTNNDDSCDIGVAPAATLLLPYFEVSSNPAGETTIFTITNVTRMPQIAHVTLWTDWTYPVVDFNIFLTGYDVQSINLHDVIYRGIIAPASQGAGPGTSSTNTTISPRNTVLSAANTANPAHYLGVTQCASLPGTIPEAYRVRMVDAFTLGVGRSLTGTTECAAVGNVHTNAVGYVTIDVARYCGFGLPDEPGQRYFREEIGWENALVGDYQQVNSLQNYAQGNPMVHIRAMNETASADVDHNLPRTFYQRWSGGLDRRQPLPSRFAARWISGGTGSFETFFKIWREGVTTGATVCPNYGQNRTLFTEILTFDERENHFASTTPPGTIISPQPPTAPGARLPETSLTPVTASSIIPQVTNGATGGWVYMNLNNLTAPGGAEWASQNWVVVSMRAEGRYSVDFDAAWLGNGCSPAIGISRGTDATSTYYPGPSANMTPTYGVGVN